MTFSSSTNTKNPQAKLRNTQQLVIKHGYKTLGQMVTFTALRSKPSDTHLDTYLLFYSLTLVFVVLLFKLRSFIIIMKYYTRYYKMLFFILITVANNAYKYNYFNSAWRLQYTQLKQQGIEVTYKLRSIPNLFISGHNGLLYLKEDIVTFLKIEDTCTAFLYTLCSFQQYFKHIIHPTKN